MVTFIDVLRAFMEFGVFGNLLCSLIINKEVDGVVLAEAKFGYELCRPFRAAGYGISGDVFGFHGREGDDRLFLCDPFDRATGKKDNAAGDGFLVEGFPVIGVRKGSEYEVGKTAIHVVGDAEGFGAVEITKDVFYGIPMCPRGFDIELG